MDSKTAEFASLFALFEDIATRRSRMTDDDGDDDRQVLADAIPKDLEPIVRNLASLVDTHPQVQGRSRRNTVTTGSEGKFPLGARYPFTFKMMLHKLYELEDWGKKVKDVLERSQNEFKPLSETPEKPKDKERKVAPPTVLPEPRVRFEKGTVVGRPRRGSVATTTTTTTTRPRSHTVGAIGRPKDLVTTREKPEKSKEKDRETPDDVRIIKKRCVGRRQPSEALTEDSSVRKRHWVYDAAVSSFEVNERRRSVESITPIPGDKEDLQDAGSAKTPGTRRRAASMYVGAGEGASAGRKRRAMSIIHVTSPRGTFDGGKTVSLAA